MFAEAAKLSDEQFAQRLRQALEDAFSEADSSVETAGGPVRDGLRIAAAIRSTFFPPDLLPYRVSPVPDGAFQLILPDSHRLLDSSDENSSLWTLNEDVRAATLSRLASDNSLGTVLWEVSYPEDDLLPRLLREALDTPIPDLFRLTDRSEAELATLLQISRWTGSYLSGLPATAEISRQLDLDRLLATARHLADDKFSGRKEVLLGLRHLLGLADSREAKPVMLHGPGGIGKSTLISQLLLEHTTGECDPPILFAWLDFDRPGLSAREPLTLMEDILRQLALQLPDEKSDFDFLKERLSEFTNWTFERGPNEYEHQLESIGFSRASSSSLHEQLGLINDLRFTLRSANRPFLVVVDTFEEVQFHHRDSIFELFQFLDQLIHIIPSTRLLVSGRRFEEDTGPIHLENFPLTELRPAGVREFLEKHGIPESAAATIGSELGGNPLTLRLAMEVWKREQEAGNGWSDDPEAQRQFFRSVLGERVQGQLYRRILSHISDPIACKLACPGLVLRRITPDIIHRVLAGPCELPIPSLEHAFGPFNTLAREDTLVSRDGNSLVHRSDVRRDMLRLLEASEPDRVNAIHSAAVAYYATFNPPNRPPGTPPDLASAAEEVYHRYFLDDPEEIIESRWIPGIEPFLTNALQDLPRTDLQQRLASRLGTEELGDQSRRESDDLSWERMLIPKVRRCLDHDDYPAAIALLEERDYRSPGSPLYNMYAIALARMDRLHEALAVAERGLQDLDEQGSSPETHALQSTAAGTLRRMSRLPEAAELYWAAAQSAEKTGSTIQAIEYYLQAAAIQKEEGWLPVSRRDIAHSLERLIESLTPSEWIKHRNLMFQAIPFIQEALPKSSGARGILDYLGKAIDWTKIAGKATSGKVPDFKSSGDTPSGLHDWILEQLTSRFSESELENLTERHFSMRIKEISRGGSIRNTAEDILLWAERTGELGKLRDILRGAP